MDHLARWFGDEGRVLCNVEPRTWSGPEGSSHKRAFDMCRRVAWLELDYRVRPVGAHRSGTARHPLMNDLNDFSCGCLV